MSSPAAGIRKKEEEEEDGRVCAQRKVSELQREEEEAHSGAAVQDR